MDEVRVSLRVAAPDLDPDAVTRQLGISPSFSARRGERRPSRSGEITQPIGIWILQLGESPEWQLEDAITTLMKRLPTDVRVWHVLGSQATVDLFCGPPPRGLESWF